MKKILTLGLAAAIGAGAAYSQSPIDAYRLSQPDLKGTARYMSMAGAFGALGGDLSTLSHNPAGIGVYRNNEVGFTLDLDMQHSESKSNAFTTGVDQTKFYLNNIGFVWTLRLPSTTCPNFNIGFTYDKSTSFNRRYRGAINLTNSLSNYIAATTTEGGYTPGQLLGETDKDDPYNPTSGYGAPWLSVLAAQGYLISSQPVKGYNKPNYEGQWNSNTSGIGYFDVTESGCVDSYNIALGGNISNVVYWGMDFDITHMSYTLTPNWTEYLTNAQVPDDNDVLETMNSQWTLSNYYRCTGTGFNYKLGLIVKPIQELRLGFSFQTPTWYNLTENFWGDLDAVFTGQNKDPESVLAQTPEGYNTVNFRTPWKINASAAAVLFNRLIISAEYEWTKYKSMKYSTPTYYGYGNDYGYWDDFYPYPWDPWDPYAASSNYDPYISNDSYYYTNENIREYYRSTNTLRLGAEFRVTPQLSVRAGYSVVSSPVNDDAKSYMIETAGTVPNYRWDNTTNYVTCGLGYKIKNFYIDLAYVYKQMSSTFHAFSPWYNFNEGEAGYIPNKLNVETQTAALSFKNSQVVLSAGFKF
ncbi:MAG: outer membrane protein transport protein [Muribaculaceae bacterium]|nr:outer membrane protein transport protein [Muribaculaceae bacterium]